MNSPLNKTRVCIVYLLENAGQWFTCRQIIDARTEVLAGGVAVEKYLRLAVAKGSVAQNRADRPFTWSVPDTPEGRDAAKAYLASPTRGRGRSPTPFNLDRTPSRLDPRPQSRRTAEKNRDSEPGEYIDDDRPTLHDLRGQGLYVPTHERGAA